MLLRPTFLKHKTGFIHLPLHTLSTLVKMLNVMDDPKIIIRMLIHGDLVIRLFINWIYVINIAI